MGHVKLAEDVLAATWVYSESLIRVQVVPSDTKAATDLADGLQQWITDFLDRWSWRDGRHLTPDELYTMEANVSLENVRPLRDGSVLFDIIKPPSDSAYQSIVADLLSRLRHFWFDTTVQLYRPQGRPMLGQRGVLVTTTAVWVSPTLTDEAQSRPPGPYADSQVPRVRRSDLGDGVLQRIIDHAVQWCQIPDAQLFLIYRDECLRLDVNSARYELERALQETDREAISSVLLLAEKYPHRARSVGFTVSAEVMYHDMIFADKDFTPAYDALAVATAVLSDLAPALTSGCALRGNQHGDISSLTTPSVWPTQIDRAPHDFKSLRVLFDSWVLDAFPVMYLGPGFPDLPPSLAAYEVTAVGLGHLLITKNPREWFSGIRPHRDLVHQARSELDEIILDRQTFLWLTTQGRQNREGG